MNSSYAASVSLTQSADTAVQPANPVRRTPTRTVATLKLRIGQIPTATPSPSAHQTAIARPVRLCRGYEPLSYAIQKNDAATTSAAPGRVRWGNAATARSTVERSGDKTSATAAEAIQSTRRQRC